MSLAAIFVLLLVSALQLLDRYLNLTRKRGSHSDEQLKLQLEIQQLLKEASQLSTPSTFAQAAKLKRLAAAKEKELAKIHEQEIKGKQSVYDQYGRVLLIAKFPNIFYSPLEGCFPEKFRCCYRPCCGWNTPVAVFYLSSQQVAVPKTQPHTSASIAPFEDSVFPDQFLPRNFV